MLNINSPMNCLWQGFTIIFLISSGICQPRNTAPELTLRSGTLELGVAGSVLFIEDMTSATFSLRGGVMREVGAGCLLGVETELGYSHIRAEDQISLQGYFTWQNPIEGTPLYVFLMAGGGIRPTWLGSFRYTTFPMGGNIGVRFMFNNNSAFRMEYSFRRILNAPVANFSEHRLLLGISLFFGNKSPSEKPKGGDKYRRREK